MSSAANMKNKFDKAIYKLCDLFFPSVKWKCLYFMGEGDLSTNELLFAQYLSTSVVQYCFVLKCTGAKSHLYEVY